MTTSPLFKKKNVLTNEIAEQFLEVEDDDSVDLKEFTAVEDVAVKSLGKHWGELSLNGLKRLSDTAANSFSKHRGLFLWGLTILSDAAVESLGKKKGGVYSNLV